jgi:hypothetical protein
MAAKNKRHEKTDEQEILEELIELMINDIRNEGGRFKVAELLKTLEVKRKLAPTDDREKVFWEMLNKLRVEELPGKKGKPKEKKMQTQSAKPVAAKPDPSLAA